LGLGGVSPLRPALLFAAFETAMPLVGIAAGYAVRQRFETFAVYAGAAVLAGLGVHALREAGDPNEGTAAFSFGTARGMVLAGIGISTDELAMGFPLGAERLPVGPVLAAIGAQAFLVTVMGIWLGGRLGAALRLRTARAAGTAAGAAFLLLAVLLAAERALSGGR
jgi:manganese efflux pump family protein